MVAQIWLDLETVLRLHLAPERVPPMVPQIWLELEMETDLERLMER